MIQFRIPEEKRVRVILDSDVKNEVDDQFAIVHALLTESLDIRGIIPTHFGTEKSPHSQQDSQRELQLLLDKMHPKKQIRVANGAEACFLTMQGKEIPEGARLIIEEAMQTGERPLYLAFLGPLTDLAIALTAAPQISAQNIKVIWIGGLQEREGGPEPNLKNDIKAAQIVFNSDIELWQVPRDVYSMLPVSFAELYTKVFPYGEIGKYLAENVISFNNGSIRKPAEYRVLGDSPAVGLLLNAHCGKWYMGQAPVIEDDMSYSVRADKREIRVYESIDTRFILEDFFAKLKLAAM